MNNVGMLYLEMDVIVTSHDFLYLRILVSCDMFWILDIEILVPCEYLVSFWSFGLRDFLARSYLYHGFVLQNALYQGGLRIFLSFFFFLPL